MRYLANSPMAPERAESAEQSNRKLGGILFGVILLLVLIAIIGVLTLN
jgi:hypothetical protein